MDIEQTTREADALAQFVSAVERALRAGGIANADAKADLARATATMLGEIQDGGMEIVAMVFQRPPLDTRTFTGREVAQLVRQHVEKARTAREGK